MKRLLKNLNFLKSMFSQLIASFILIIIIISLFHLVTNWIYTQNMEKMIADNVGESLGATVQEYELYFDNIKNKMLMDFYIQYSDKLKNPKKHDYLNTQILKKIGKYPLMYPFIKDFIVYIRDFEYVITLNGTLEKEIFFKNYYESGYYTEKFWQDEMNRNFMYKIYPQKEFVLNDPMKQSAVENLLPIAMKHASGTDFIIIVLIDINQFSKSLKTDFTKDFFILDNANIGTVIYSDEDPANEQDESFMYDISLMNDLPGYTKMQNGYLFTYISSQNSLTYCKYYPDTIIKDQINETNKLMTLIILMAIMISILLSFFIVKKFNNPVKHIYKLIKGSGHTENGRDIISFKNIKESITGIVNQNTDYAKDIDEKNSLLKNYFWQTRLKNIILEPGESVRNQAEYTNYAVVLFKIHYRNAYYENISKEINEGTLVLKDLIDIYIYEEFSDAVTFQNDEKQIISIVGVKKDVDKIGDSVDKIVHKLANEDEFVYFTVAYSRVYNSSSDLHQAYERVSGALRYRRFMEKTQVLSENIMDKKLDMFYFSKNQQEQFANLLESGRKDECLQLIDGIFDYNLKKETNELCIYMLYVQVIDCCTNVLMQLYNEIPGRLPFKNDDFILGQSESAVDYKKRYGNIIEECINYIINNKKQSDIIIDFVKNYINENYSKDISVDLLADKLKISRTYLSRYFKNNTGMNLSDYLNAFRMKKACMLLQNSFLMVKEIAPRVGISNISTFLRLFKSYTGKTPNDYRKSNIQ